MRTPAGSECRFYYEDFNRGRSTQECRLGLKDGSAEWDAKICTGCPVPAILAANGDPNLMLEGEISKGILGFGRKITVSASCNRHMRNVPKPQVGCPECAKDRKGLEELFKGL